MRVVFLYADVFPRIFIVSLRLVSRLSAIIVIYQMGVPFDFEAQTVRVRGHTSCGCGQGRGLQSFLLVGDVAAADAQAIDDSSLAVSGRDCQGGPHLL